VRFSLFYNCVFVVYLTLNNRRSGERRSRGIYVCRCFERCCFDLFYECAFLVHKLNKLWFF
jgi:hypothetical protein